MLRELVQDLRFGWRAMRQAPVLALVGVATLGIGIGTNTAIFSLIQGILLRPLSYADAGRLVAVLETRPDRGATRLPTSPANYLDWKRRSRTVESLTAATIWSPTLTGRGRPEQLRALRATPELFDLLGVEPLLGRGFRPSPGADARVVLLGHGLWQRRFGGAAQIVGEKLVLEGEPFEVIGVMPPGFRFPPFWAEDRELWAPLVFDAAGETLQSAANRDGRYLRVFGRLVPGVSLAQAHGELDTIGAALAAEFPRENANSGIGVESLHEPVVSRVRPALLALSGAVIAVLLIACANVANLLLARGTARAHEFAVRSALGASRGRLARQALTESLLLAALGGAAGVVCGIGALRGLQRFGPVDLPRLDEVTLDARVLAFTVALSLVTGLAFGMVPALRASRAGARSTGRSRGSASAAGSGPRQVLVVVECALALVLVAAAGLLLNSFARILDVEPGFSAEDRFAFDLRFAERYASAESQDEFLSRIGRELRRVPGVSGVGAVHAMHIGGDTWGLTFTSESAGHRESATLNASPRVVTAGFFEALAIPLERGRDFEPTDRTDAVAVVAVNRSLARRFWPDGDAVGKRLKWGDRDADAPWRTVVAVVGDVHQDDLVSAVRPEVYFPYSQNPFPSYRNATLLVHAPGSASALLQEVERSVGSVDARIPVSEPRALERVLAASRAAARFNATLVTLFGLVALLLAAIGIYGVIAYSVSRRTGEIGLRVALGARPGEIRGMVLAQGLRLAAAGVVLGLPVALLAGRLLSTLLFQVDPGDLATLALTAAVLIGVALAACYVPAWRASRVEPVAALRCD